MRKDFLVFGSPQICQEDIDEVVDTLKSGWWGTGPKTHLFEERFREYMGCKHAIAVNSCTAGMHLVLTVLGVKEGDEVITTPMTFTSTAGAIMHCGARPVFVDIEKDTFNIDPERIEKAITPRTKVIMPVHMAGRPCKMDEIMDIARRHNLYVVEDAAHAVEAWYRDKKIGNIGDITVFSFYVTKNLATGEGGMVTTNNEELVEEIRLRSLHGISKDAWKRYSAAGFQPYETIYLGYKYNMMDIQASLGLHQLARLENNHKLREKYWKMYNQAFQGVPQLIIPVEESGIRHAHHLYTILIKLERLRVDRNEFIKALQRENIGAGIHFIAVHLHKYYREIFGFKRGDFPNAEFVSDRTISLPLSAALTEEDVADVITAVKKTAVDNKI